eukprot:1306880-Amphidinium_carterae.1
MDLLAMQMLEAQLCPILTIQPYPHWFRLFTHLAWNHESMTARSCIRLLTSNLTSIWSFVTFSTSSVKPKLWK